MPPKTPPPGFKVYGANGNGSNGAAASPWSRPVPLVGQIERADYPLQRRPTEATGQSAPLSNSTEASSFSAHLPSKKAARARS